jgi:hypothetical protein
MVDFFHRTAQEMIDRVDGGPVPAHGGRRARDAGRRRGARR